MSSIDQQFVEFIVKSLVGNPDAVQIERRIDEKGVLLELTVSPDDLGRVIGKHGATAQSLRTLLRALGTKNDARYNLKIVDNGVAPQRREEPVVKDVEAPAEEPAPQTDSTENDDEAPDNELEEQVEDEEAEEDEQAQEEDENSVVSKTRRELEDLDDLDV